MIRSLEATHIIGSEIRTTNDDARCFTDIPLHWQRFMQDNLLAKIPEKMDGDIYGVYTHFENAGKNNQGQYSLIIGCRVTDTAIAPADLTAITIPAGNYRQFHVENGQREKVGETWQTIWSIPTAEKQNWSFKCEFELYQANGEIDIFIGLK
jgi:predicted transcriptional regulator YdeE